MITKRKNAFAMDIIDMKSSKSESNSRNLEWIPMHAGCAKTGKCEQRTNKSAPDSQAELGNKLRRRTRRVEASIVLKKTGSTIERDRNIVFKISVWIFLHVKNSYFITNFQVLFS